MVIRTELVKTFALLHRVGNVGKAVFGVMHHLGDSIMESMKICSLIGHFAKAEKPDHIQL